MTITAQVPRSGPEAGDGSTVAFTYGFLIDADTELVVQVLNTSTNALTIKTLSTDYSVAGAGNVSGGTVTFVTAPTALEQVAFTRAVPLVQGLDLQNRGVVSPSLLEQKYDDLYRIAQDNSEAIGRAVKTDVFGVVDQAQLSLYLDTLSGISGEIATVAGISGNVTTVAGIAGNVTTVAGINADVTTVAGIAADVTTVAGISANVTSVAGNTTNINTVAGINANVTTVAGISADVTQVAADTIPINAASANAAAAAASAAAALVSEGNAATSETNAAASAAAAVNAAIIYSIALG